MGLLGEGISKLFSEAKNFIQVISGQKTGGKADHEVHFLTLTPRYDEHIDDAKNGSKKCNGNDRVLSNGRIVFTL